MNRCAEHRFDGLRLALAGALALVLAACGSAATRTPAAKPAPVEAPEPAPTPAGPDKGDPDARFKDALQLLKDKQPQEAQAAFAKLADDFPEFSGPLTNLGILYAQGKQRDQALVAFNKAVADNPQNPVAQNWVGILYRERNDYARAESAYLKALKAKPDYAPAHLNLGILYDVYWKRPQDALAQYREYQRLTGGDRLIVTAWIKQLEETAAAPAAPGAKPVEQKP
jgi:tetratricopeptide (TPR) repeat protein